MRVYYRKVSEGSNYQSITNLRYFVVFSAILQEDDFIANNRFNLCRCIDLVINCGRGDKSRYQ